MNGRRLLACLLGLSLSGPSAAQESLAVGSKNFTESRLLAEIMAQVIEAHTDLAVQRRVNLGGTTLVFTALQAGDIDLYPEYTGTGWAVHLSRTDPVNDPLRAYLEVRAAFEERFGLTWLTPFGFSNTYALAMAEDAAARLGVERISDLAPHQANLRLAFSHEFLNREDGYPGLAAAYGLDVADPRGMEHGLAYEALRTGAADVVDTYSTDGKLLRFPVRVLVDDRRFFPPYDAAPVIRMDTLERHPEVGAALQRLAFRLDDATMRRLNYRVEEEGGPFEQVAAEFLAEAGLGSGTTSAEPAVARQHDLLPFLWSRRGETLRLAGQHLTLTVLAVVLAILLAVPLGILLTRRKILAAPVLGIAGVIQTIPNLALLAFLLPLPFLGLGAPTALVALFLYSVLPILRNTYTGIREVDPDLREAARGMGLRGNEILRHVELPLAARTIMAGIRTATVISIGVATLAAFIGAGGLGDPIVTGLQLNDLNLILSGAIPAALLALAADFVLARVEKVLGPKGLDG